MPLKPRSSRDENVPTGDEEEEEQKRAHKRV